MLSEGSVRKVVSAAATAVAERGSEAASLRTVPVRESGVLTAANEASEARRDFDVVLIREGLSKSGRYYSRRVVEQIAAAADGQRAFADHPTATEDRERPVRSIRDVVGFYRAGRTSEVADPATGEARLQAEATLRLFKSAGWLASLAREAL